MHVVLHQPEIPQNTGNIGRTCVAVGAKLWLVRPLGFRLDAKHLRRAGMDYWQDLTYEAVDDWPALLRKLAGVRTWLVEGPSAEEPSPGGRCVWDADVCASDAFVFGSEGRGLPRSILEASPAARVWLPMPGPVRSLNLASTVNTVCYEALRRSHMPPGGAASVAS